MAQGIKRRLFENIVHVPYMLDDQSSVTVPNEDDWLELRTSFYCEQAIM